MKKSKINRNEHTEKIPVCICKKLAGNEVVKQSMGIAGSAVDDIWKKDLIWYSDVRWILETRLPDKLYTGN